MAIGPRAQRKTKGGVLLAEPGFMWAMFLFPARWYAVESVYDRSGGLVAHHVDICRPLEDTGGMLSFLDLKLDLLICADGKACWLDQDDYQAEVDAGTILPAWQKAVSETAAALDRERARGAFPPDVIRSFRPPGPTRTAAHAAAHAALDDASVQGAGLPQGPNQSRAVSAPGRAPGPAAR